MYDGSYDVVISTPGNPSSVATFDRVADLQMFLEKLPTTIYFDQHDSVTITLTKTKD